MGSELMKLAISTLLLPTEVPSLELGYAPLEKSWMGEFGQSMNLPIMCYFHAALFPWW